MKPSSPWVQLVDPTGIAQNAYRRPLGLTELAFYWDHVFNGTATTIQDIHVEVTAGSEETLSEKAVERAWARLKQTFPLIGAQLDEHPDEVGVDFVVREENLQSARYGELRFESAGSSDEVQAVVEHLMNGPTTLTNDKIAELWVIRRKDAPRQFHLLLVVAHVITDGMAGATLMRHLCQELSLPSVDPVPALWERLQVVPALENLYPSASMSAPRRRWCQAIGRVIYNIRNAKLQGGHTLPRKASSTGSSLLAVSRTDRIELPESTSLGILATCRKLGITFGNAFPVLSQIAHSRVLHRLRFQKGEIGDSEWTFRLQQPMHFSGPLNFRPYLDEDWYKNKGGASEVVLAINFYDFTLPSLPRSSLPLDSWRGNYPPYESLLSRERFLFRSRMVRQQAATLLKHPLFVDINACKNPGRLVRSRNFGVKWRAAQKDNSVTSIGTNGTNVAGDVPFVFSNGGASLGNRDPLMPYSYPVLKDKSGENLQTTLEVIDVITYLRCRPTELYLGASTSKQRLCFFLYWDSNAYADDLVREWAAEVKAAALHYLGQCPQEDPVANSPSLARSKL